MYNLDHPKTPIKHYHALTQDLLIKGGYLRSHLIMVTPYCRLSSVGDLTDGGVLTCAYHGNQENPIENPTKPPDWRDYIYEQLIRPIGSVFDKLCSCF